MHEIDFVHGDLLPRNVVFDITGDGYVTDFDLSRKVGTTYVRGYNYWKTHRWCRNPNASNWIGTPIGRWLYKRTSRGII